jgi:ABC-type Mn2+/Zn2+ transport system ATPase subunit
VLIARALMMRPKLLLLDEPTSGVDESAVRTITSLLSELASSEGMAILIVSHQLGVLRDVASAALWVADGQVKRHRTDELLAPERLEQLFSKGGQG